MKREIDDGEKEREGAGRGSELWDKGVKVRGRKREMGER